MTCRVICIALIASLFAMPPAAAASRKPGKGDLHSNLARVSSFCEQAVLRAPGTGFPLPSLRGVGIHGGAPRDSGVPDLVKRFAARQPMARIFSAPTFNLHFQAPGGDVWALVYDSLPTCDVMVTGASGDMPATAARLAESLAGDGWQIAAFRPATATMPLSKHILVKRLPKPGMPDFGLMLVIRAPAGEAADPAGVQLELDFIAGKVENSPGSPEVGMEVKIPAGRAGTPDPR